jgi:hypothetical protein
MIPLQEVLKDKVAGGSKAMGKGNQVIPGSKEH